MTERDFDHPAVQAIVEYSKRLAPQKGIDISLFHVGDSTLVYRTFEATINEDEVPVREEILFGLVAPDGEPFVSLVPLSMIPDDQKLAEALTKAKDKYPGMFKDPQEDNDYIKSRLDRPNWQNENARAK